MIDEALKKDYAEAVKSFEDLKDAITEIGNSVKQHSQSKNFAGKLKAKEKIESLTNSVKEISRLSKFLDAEVIPKLNKAVKKAEKEGDSEDLKTLKIQQDRVNRMAAAILNAFGVKKLGNVNMKAFDYMGKNLDKFLEGRTLPEELQEQMTNVKVHAEKLLQTLKKSVSQPVIEERLAPIIFNIKKSLDEMASKKLRKLSPQNAATILNYVKSDISRLSQSAVEYAKASREELRKAGTSPEEIIKGRNILTQSWNRFVEGIRDFYQNAAEYESTGKWRTQFKVHGKDFEMLQFH